MHTVVCIKQVPDTTEVRIDPDRGTLVREGVPSILNPLDAYAVEAAVRLRETGGGTVTALSMGPPQAEAVVREAVARGADRGILLTDRRFAGADTWSTSYTLACAVRTLGDVSMVLCGKQAIDGDTAQVGPGMAAHLGWPQVTFARRLLTVEEGHVLVERMTDHGAETLRCPLPAVLTALKDLNVPRLPSLVSQMRARRCAVESWGADAIEGDPAEYGLDGSPTRVVRVFPPLQRAECRFLGGGPEAAAGELARLLRERQVV